MKVRFCVMIVSVRLGVTVIKILLSISRFIRKKTISKSIIFVEKELRGDLVIIFMTPLPEFLVCFKDLIRFRLLSPVTSYAVSQKRPEGTGVLAFEFLLRSAKSGHTILYAFKTAFGCKN